MRNLSTAMAAETSARGGRPLVLITLRQNTPGVDRLYRLATRSNGSPDTFTLDGVTYRVDVAGFSPVGITLPDAGRGRLDTGELVLSNPDEEGDPWSDLFDGGALDGARLSFWLLWITGSETAADRLYLGDAEIQDARWDARHVHLRWRDGLSRVLTTWPSDRFTTNEYSFVPPDVRGRIKPVVLGDLTGAAFDVSTPGDATWRHVLCPWTNPLQQQCFVGDTGTSSGQEDLLVIDGVMCQIPTASRTISGDSLAITSDQLHAWVMPCGINSLTNAVENAEGVTTGDLNDVCEVEEGDVIAVDMPAFSPTPGALGAGSTLVASDVIVHVIYSKCNSGDSNSGVLSILKDGSVIDVGHMNVSLNGAGVSTESQSIGDHVAAWSDLGELTVKVEGAVGTSGVYVHRILMRVVFHADAMPLTGRVYRSQRGFIEDVTSALTDYRDGGYLLPSGRTATPFQNPADQVEVLLRHRDFGLGLSASTWTNTGNTLGAAIGNGTSWQLDDDTEIEVGDLILCDDELVRVESVGEGALTVWRGYDGSRVTCHSAGTVLYAVGTGGQLNSGSFRGAAAMLRHESGGSMVSNGAMEGTYASGVAPSWSEYDPDGKFTCTHGTGFVRRSAQEITRDGAGGSILAGVRQTMNLASGAWYRVSGRVKADDNSAEVLIGTTGVDFSGWEFDVSGEWREAECVFKAWDTSMTLTLCPSEGAGSSVTWDEVACVRLEGWKWDHVLDEECDADSWLESASEQTGLRLLTDGLGRIAARGPGAREPVAVFDESVIVSSRREIGGDTWRKIPFTVGRTPANDVYTGVEVRYGYDHVHRGYTGMVSIGCTEESTGETVVSYGGGFDGILTASGTGVFPSGRWTSGTSSSAPTVSGTERNTISIPGATFVSDGVEAGDWLWLSDSANGVTMLVLIDEVGSNTTVTCREPLPEMGIVRYAAFPSLFRAGGFIFIPWVSGGPGTPSASFNAYSHLDAVSGGVVFEVGASPEVGDTIWRVTVTSDDGTGLRDQSETLRHDRERRAVVRSAYLDGPRTKAVDAPLVHDRETACAVRDRLFDRADRRWEITLSTDLSTIACEVGDVVDVEHELVPGGSLRCEIVKQSVNVAEGTVEWGLVGV